MSLQDAVVAVLLLESSTASSASLVHVANPLHTTFPEDPVAEYKGTAKKVLEGLGLAFLWPEEARRLEQVTVRLKENIAAGEGQEALPTPRVASDYTQVSVFFILINYSSPSIRGGDQNSTEPGSSSASGLD